MSVDQILPGFIHLAVVLVLLVIGKWVYDGLHRSFALRTELLEKDNLAVGLAVAGYYLGLVIVLGGVVSGPASFSLLDDVIGLAIFGLLGIVLLNVSAWINDKVVFSKFAIEREIVEDRKAGVGALEGANYVAVGLITAGAMSGEGGLPSGLAFWIAGLAALIVAGILYDRITSYDLHDELERNNLAVAAAFAGGARRLRQRHSSGRRGGLRLLEREPDRVRVLHAGRAGPAAVHPALRRQGSCCRARG